MSSCDVYGRLYSNECYERFDPVSLEIHPAGTATRWNTQTANQAVGTGAIVGGVRSLGHIPGLHGFRHRHVRRALQSAKIGLGAL